MPNIAAGFGLLGLGVMVFVAVSTLAFSLFHDEPPLSYDNGSFSRRNERFASDTRSTSDPRTLKRKKKERKRTSSASICSDSCSICKETIESDKLKKLLCNHCFHSQCIRDWFDSCTSSSMQRTGTCPMCRRKFSSLDLI